MIDSVSSSDDRELTGALKKGKKILGRSAKLVKKTLVGTGKGAAKTAVGMCMNFGTYHHIRSESIDSNTFCHYPRYHKVCCKDVAVIKIRVNRQRNWLFLAAVGRSQGVLSLSMERAVLNGRRMAFDCGNALLEDVSEGGDFAEKRLRSVFSFSLQSREQIPDSFIEFLDRTSRLRLLPLDDIDCSSQSVFCLFVNLCHYLLPQTLLLSDYGPLNKKNFTQFVRTSCYEIGGDVFSLAELQCCYRKQQK